MRQNRVSNAINAILKVPNCPSLLPYISQLYKIPDLPSYPYPRILSSIPPDPGLISNPGRSLYGPHVNSDQILPKNYRIIHTLRNCQILIINYGLKTTLVSGSVAVWAGCAPTIVLGSVAVRAGCATTLVVLVFAPSSTYI